MTSPFKQILLADDDKDDRLFFKEAIEDLQLSVNLTTVNDGEQLMSYLSELVNAFPQVIYLDMNMPRKNGFECLIEIKENQKFQSIPVIVYSTSYDEFMASELYLRGAHYYICKPADFNELKRVVLLSLTLLQQNTSRPRKENFLISKPRMNL